MTLLSILMFVVLQNMKCEVEMIDSYTATSVIVGFLLIFGLVLPILDRIPKIKDFISFRWILVVVYLSLSIGVIIDFGHLDTSVRFAVVVGGIILSSLFLLVRSLEKAAVNKWKLPRVRGKVQKGNISGELSVSSKLEESKFSDKQIKENQSIINNQEKDTFDDVIDKALSSEGSKSQT